jgi:CheY-like chemotaxis protein
MKLRKILVVEDNTDHRFILVHQLRKVGQVAIFEATHGQEALEVVVREVPHLIFMNLKLPVLDGWEAVRRIRAMDGPVREVPIIAHTAYVTAVERERALAIGCDEYLPKPILDVAQLHHMVERLLARGSAG